MAYHNNLGLVADAHNLSLRLGLDTRGPVRPVPIKATQSTVSNEIQNMKFVIDKQNEAIRKQNQAIFQLRKYNAAILNFWLYI